MTYQPKIKCVNIALKLVNQELFCEPGAYTVREGIEAELVKYCSSITRVIRVKSTRYHVGDNIEISDDQQYYRSCMAAKEVLKALQTTHNHIQEIQEKAAAYVKRWTQYQYLWDTDHHNMEAHLGDETADWQMFLTDVWKKRSVFDTSETKIVFNEVACIEFGRVQTKVNVKYDTWHKELLQKFGAKLNTQSTEMWNAIERARQELEESSVENGNTNETVKVVTAVQKHKRMKAQWTTTMDICKDSQKLLERQRYQFSSQWLYVEQLEGSWTSFNDILDRRDAQIQEQIASLQIKMVSEEKLIEQRTGDNLSEWDSGKPVKSSASPEQALSSLAIFEKKLKKTADDREQVEKAKEALELDTHLSNEAADRKQRLTAALDEIGDLKLVWQGLQDINAQLDQVRETAWPAVQPRNVRKSLETLVNLLKSDQFPTKLRQYNVYITYNESIKKLLKVNTTVIELKSPKMKERHWKSLVKTLRLGASWANINDRTLGNIWDIDLIRNEKLVREVLTVAQGEMALEQFINQTKDLWENYALELIQYQTKCKLIRGWDDLFNKLRDNQNALSAMKLSPYYKVFDEQAAQLEGKLNNLAELFDVWIDVQRRWVYLDGIFSGSADIQNLLPMESQRFASISNEFTGLMRKVQKSPLVLDVLQITGVQRSLQRLADLLQKIQKALGEYLERERNGFPRFFFVGDQDLLEIIGNSKAIPRLQKHFKKMFAGINTLQLEDSDKIISGIASREGEIVQFDGDLVISTEKHARINDWLTRVEDSMKKGLAKQFHASFMKFTSIGQVDSIKIF